MAGYGAKDSSGDFYFKALGDGEIKLGNTSDDLIHVTGTLQCSGTLEVNGDIKTNQYIYRDDGTTRTLINLADDKIILKAGNKAMVTMETNSSAPHEVTLNDGSNNIDFVVKGNGSNQGNPGMKFDASTNKLGINGVGTPSWELDVAGDIGLAEYIYHRTDTDTFIRFEDDVISFKAGNQELLRLSEGTQDEVVINENNNDVDFRVESSYATHMFYIDGANHRIGVGTNSPQSVLHIVDPLDGTGVERDAVIIMKSKKETGIKLIADSSNDNSGGEENNPFVDFYQDGQSDTSGRGQRNASIAMEGPTGTTFTGSLANAFFMDAHVPNSPHSNRPLQLASDSTNGGHAARITLEGTNGYVGVHTNTPSTEMEIAGTTKSTHYVTAVTTQDLGSGTSSTLSVNSGVVLLDADSINGSEMMGQEVHFLTIPNGDNSGQRLSLIVKTNTNNVNLMPDGIISGSYHTLNNSIGITALELMWISEGSHNAWHQV